MNRPEVFRPSWPIAGRNRDAREQTASGEPGELAALGLAAEEVTAIASVVPQSVELALGSVELLWDVPAERIATDAEHDVDNALAPAEGEERTERATTLGIRELVRELSNLRSTCEALVEAIGSEDASGDARERAARLAGEARAWLATIPPVDAASARVRADVIEGDVAMRTVIVEGTHRALVELDALARDVFGDEAHAERWFSLPNRTLGGRTPRECLETSEGRSLVHELLGAIRHGHVM